MTPPTGSSERPARLTFAANNGEVGGGEVMLLAMAEAATDLGIAVTVVGPAASDGVVERARRAGYVGIDLAPTRAAYLRELRRWDRSRSGLLWCNGLVPALATTGHRDRVVHLHRLPRGLHRVAAAIARRGAPVVVPSTFMAGAVGAARVMGNWSSAVAAAPQPDDSEVPRLGFLGRWAAEKGLDVLADAVAMVSATTPVRLVVSGGPRFATDSEVAAIEAGLDRLGTSVERVGWAAVADVLSRIDVLVVPSRDPESFGLVVTEAMSAGIPVIVTDAGALPEVVGPDHPWIARAGSTDSLATTITAFLEMPEAARSAVARRQRERWQEHFSPEAGRRRFEALLRDLRAVRS